MLLQSEGNAKRDRGILELLLSSSEVPDGAVIIRKKCKLEPLRDWTLISGKKNGFPSWGASQKNRTPT
jgi:hypothetical protein